MAELLAAEIEGKRRKALLEELTAELSKIVPPEGEKFEYFRDRKIELHFYLLTTADVEGFQKGLAALQKELAAENRIDAPARVTISTEKPQPHVPIQIVVMPEKVRYITVDGQTIETLVKSPEQLESFLREQRILDKVAEIAQYNRRLGGLPEAPWETLRPVSTQVKSHLPREIALRRYEEKLDGILEDQKGGMPPNPLAQSANPRGGRDPFALINEINELNRQNQRGLKPPSSLPSQMEYLLRLQQIQITSPNGKAYK